MIPGRAPWETTSDFDFYCCKSYDNDWVSKISNRIDSHSWLISLSFRNSMETIVTELLGIFRKIDGHGVNSENSQARPGKSVMMKNDCDIQTVDIEFRFESLGCPDHCYQISQYSEGRSNGPE